MTSPSLPHASRGLLVANLLAQLAFGLLAMTICIPSMQEWGAQFGSSQAAVQLTFSGYVVAYGALQLLYGPCPTVWDARKFCSLVWPSPEPARCWRRWRPT